MPYPIKHIIYKGVTYPLRVSYYALSRFKTETGKEVSEMDDDMQLYEVLLWHSLIAGHSAEGVELALNREDMVWVLDESLADFAKVILESFISAADDAGDKKK